MGAVITKPAVFSTGPDDALRAIDVYAKAAVSENALPELLDNVGPVIKGLSTGVGTITTLVDNTGDILSAGITELDANNMMDALIPPDVSVVELMREFSDVPLDTLNSSIDKVSEAMDIDKYMSLDILGLSTYTRELIDILTSAILCPDGYFDGLLDIAFSIAGLKMDFFSMTECDGDFAIDFSGIPDYALPYAGRSIMSTASLLGDHRITAMVMDTVGKDTPLGTSIGYVGNVLSNYTKPVMSAVGAYDGFATNLVDDLNTINPDWISFTRNGEQVDDMQRLVNISDDARLMLDIEPRTGVSSIISSEYGTHSNSIQVLADDTYEYLQLA